MHSAHLATGIFAHSSWQNCSSSFKLDGFHWCTAIFKSYHRFSTGWRSGLWLGLSKTFKCFSLNLLSDALAVCLGKLSSWKVDLHPSLKFLNETGFPKEFPHIYHHRSFCWLWPVSQSLRGWGSRGDESCLILVSSYQNTLFHMFGESRTCLFVNSKCVYFIFFSLNNGFFLASLP